MQTILLEIVLLLEGLVLISLWVLLYQVVKQQGRILLRLDGLEEKLKQEIGDPQSLPPRLAPGTLVPSFSLPDINGRIASLEEFRGRSLLIVNWDPYCGFCEMLASELAGLEDDLGKRNIQLLLASYGDVESNRNMAREHGLKCPILMQSEQNRLGIFEGEGTPAAYLLDGHGRVTHDFAGGADQVAALVRDLATRRGSGRKRSHDNHLLTGSRIERKGLKPGTPAPGFTLPDIYGRAVSLETFQGRRVLLVFSDPHCGPCDLLAPHLVKLHERHRKNGLEVVMIGRGEPEENRRKAEEYGFEFPMVVQRKWELSKQYGIFTTPVAFLIGEDGVITRNVAIGTDEIVMMVDQELTLR